MPDSEAFDYIIVGAGSAGCVLANRLTASGRHRVLLLEAGGRDRNIWIHIPLGYGKLFADPPVNWLYTTEPEPELQQPPGDPAARQGDGRLELDQRAALYPRPARGLTITGGSSAMPAGRLTTCCRISAAPRIKERGADELHGDGGHLEVSDVLRAASAVRGLYRGGAAIGFPAQRRFQRRRRRKAPDISRLTIAKRPPLVDRGRLSERGEAAGQSQGGAERARHAHPVFRPPRHRRRISSRRRRRTPPMPMPRSSSSGGAFNSPQLLQLSGLGPAKILRDPRHRCRRRHARASAPICRIICRSASCYRCNQPITMNDVINQLAPPLRRGAALSVVAQAATSPCRAVCRSVFLRTRPELATPDVQFHFLIFSRRCRAARRCIRSPGFMASVCQLRPDSRGFVRIKSADPAAAAGDPAALPVRRADRLRCAVDGMKLLRRVMSEPVMRDIHRRGA